MSGRGVTPRFLIFPTHFNFQLISDPIDVNQVFSDRPSTSTVHALFLMGAVNQRPFAVIAQSHNPGQAFNLTLAPRRHLTPNRGSGTSREPRRYPQPVQQYSSGPRVCDPTFLLLSSRGYINTWKCQGFDGISCEINQFFPYIQVYVICLVVPFFACRTLNEQYHLAWT